MSIKQPEALRLAEILEGDYCPEWFYETGVDEVSAELRAQHARITELEAARFAYASEFAPTSDGDPDVSSIHANIRALKAQLAQRFDAADMATAAAQGFRDGVASLTAQAADSVQEDAARLKEVVGLLEELAEHDNYHAEYDGRMIAICPECGEQEGEHRPSCAFVRAKAYLAARAAQRKSHGR